MKKRTSTPHVIDASDRAAIMEAAAAYFLDELRRGGELTSPGAAESFIRAKLDRRTAECFLVVYLDTRHRIIEAIEEFHGTIDGATVYPRIICEHALRLGAAAVIVAHNHPSGVPEPSLADQAITRRLKEALGVLDIRLLDHFVVGDGSPVSFASRGLL